MVPAPRLASAPGLSGLRGRAALPELLFLYECATLEPARLRPIAERLGLTVQAASHTFRELRRRGLVQVENGRYRPTIEGVAQLHGSFDRLAADLRARIDRLHVIRSTRAVAAGPLSTGESVSLQIDGGLLTARRSRAGASRGTVLRGGEAGALVEVGELSGIVPIEPGTITVRTLTDSELDEPGLARRVRATLPAPSELIGAEGLEAVHTLGRATDRPFVRFACASVGAEASRVGVPSTLYVVERDLPRLLGAFTDPAPPKLRVLPVSPSRSGPSAALGRRRARGRARSGAS